MTCRPGELVLIPFPYSDLSATKKRPVLVLTSSDQRGDFIALAVTSVPQEEQAVALGKEGLNQGNLPKSSWIRLDKIFTLSTDNIVKKVATVGDSIMQDVLAGVCTTQGYSAHR